ncbi:ArsR/SmtB family transcription factor [Streptomyces malaysiense]|uniref:Transcriptional regulator n=1 Tax=Streptomyces malaysiense TaxID=1428626 RepID=A0A1J4PW88_9ACTN|nr:helix-turn-helix domain-containing protein [Streptomyces malaysiense]OIK24572.1 transcriptional regulator [Streptomyces malaysiense]
MTEHETLEPRRLDAHSLRGLAHPLRMRLLDALRVHGPATASQLAGRLGESSGATSYHLRQLAEHGFVEDAPERGRGRERWWQAVAQGLAYDSADFEDVDPEVRGLTEVFLQENAARHARELAAWIATRGQLSPAWSRAADMSNMTMRLTPELALELIEKMHALIDGYRDRVPDADTPEAQQVRIHTHLFPMDHR